MVVFKDRSGFHVAKYKGREVHELSFAKAIAEMYGIMTGHPDCIDPADIPF